MARLVGGYLHRIGECCCPDHLIKLDRKRRRLLRRRATQAWKRDVRRELAEPTG